MRGATSDKIIVPRAKGWLQVQAGNVKKRYIDVLCYYSPHFTSTLLSERDVLQSSTYAKEFSGQVMTKYFELNDEKVNQDLLSKGSIDLNHQLDYQMDYGNCTLTCVHRKLPCKNIEIPGIIRGGLCFTLPLILPDLPKDHPEACILNSSQLAYENDPKFQQECDEMAMKFLYEHQQKQHEDLIEAIDHIPEEFHSLPFHYWGTETFTIQSLSDEAQDLLWHQQLIHCGQHTLKDLH